MISKFAKQIKTLVPFLILIAFSTNQIHSEINPKCSKSDFMESGDLCVSTSEIIDEINSEFQTVYSIGNMTAISQPPLIITPKVTIQAPEAPLNLQINRKSEKTATILHPLKTKVKTSQKPHLFDVVKVLDEKGSMHLGRCLKKLNNKARERHFSGLSQELETLESLANSSKKQISPIKQLFTQSPSRKDCINYLDFILMAG